MTNNERFKNVTKVNDKDLFALINITLDPPFLDTCIHNPFTKDRIGIIILGHT